MDTQQTNQTANTQFQGGPGLDPTLNNSNPQNSNPDQPQPNTPAQPKVTGPIFIGGKRFDSMEEMAAYTSELQTKVESRQFQPAPVEQGPPKQKPSDLLFQNPDEFYAQVKKEAVDEALGIFTQRTSVTDSWKKFYDDNRDLVEHKEFVSFKLDEIKRKNPEMPIDQGMALVAKEARAYISKVRGTPQNGSVVPSGPAVVAGASNGSVVTQIPVVRQDESFVAQVRRMRKKG